MPMNIGELIKERDQIQKQLKDWGQTKVVLQAKLANLNKLIVLYDPMAEVPPEDGAAPATPRRRFQVSTDDIKDCLVPGCPKPGPHQGRCQPHYQRWNTSEQVKDLPDAKQCTVCPEEAGQWFKNQQGLMMHGQRVHVEAVA